MGELARGSLLPPLLLTLLLLLLVEPRVTPARLLITFVALFPPSQLLLLLWSPTALR